MKETNRSGDDVSVRISFSLKEDSARYSVGSNRSIDIEATNHPSKYILSKWQIDDVVTYFRVAVGHIRKCSPFQCSSIRFVLQPAKLTS